MSGHEFTYGLRHFRPDNRQEKVSSGGYFIEVATPTDQSRKKVVLAK